MSALTLLYVFGIVLHLIFFAAWFGLALPLVGRARAALAAEPSAGTLLLNDGARTIRLMSIFVVLGYVLALVTFAARVLPDGGFAVYGWPYHTAITLGLVLVIVQFALIRPAWKGLQASLGSPDADTARKRLAMGVGLGHTLWLVLVVLMFWDRLAAAAGV